MSDKARAMRFETSIAHNRPLTETEHLQFVCDTLPSVLGQYGRVGVKANSGIDSVAINLVGHRSAPIEPGSFVLEIMGETDSLVSDDVTAGRQLAVTLSSELAAEPSGMMRSTQLFAEHVWHVAGVLDRSSTYLGKGQTALSLPHDGMDEVVNGFILPTTVKLQREALSTEYNRRKPAGLQREVIVTKGPISSESAIFSVVEGLSKDGQGVTTSVVSLGRKEWLDHLGEDESRLAVQAIVDRLGCDLKAAEAYLQRALDTGGVFRDKREQYSYDSLYRELRKMEDIGYALKTIRAKKFSVISNCVLGRLGNDEPPIDAGIRRTDYRNLRNFKSRRELDQYMTNDFIPAIPDEDLKNVQRARRLLQLVDIKV